MSRGLWFGAALGLAVLALLFGMQHWPAAPQVQTRAALSPSPPSKPVTATVPAQPARLDSSLASPAGNGPAPWLNAANGQPPLGMARPRTSPEMASIQNRLQALITRGNPSAQEVDAVLADLQRVPGGASIAGLNLNALRDMLQRSDRVQEMAKQMQALAANKDPGSMARMQELVARMKEEQTALMQAAQASTRGVQR